MFIITLHFLEHTFCTLYHVICMVKCIFSHACLVRVFLTFGYVNNPIFFTLYILKRLKEYLLQSYSIYLDIPEKNFVNNVPTLLTIEPKPEPIVSRFTTDSTSLTCIKFAKSSCDTVTAKLSFR